MELGLAAAALAHIRRERILNFMELPELLAWVARARRASSGSPTALCKGGLGTRGGVSKVENVNFRMSSVMKTIEKSIIVNAPLSAVYNQWTQFEDFPQFMEGVKRGVPTGAWRGEIHGRDVNP
jgi:hypothetical protein